MSSLLVPCKVPRGMGDAHFPRKQPETQLKWVFKRIQEENRPHSPRSRIQGRTRIQPTNPIPSTSGGFCQAAIQGEGPKDFQMPKVVPSLTLL